MIKGKYVEVFILKIYNKEQYMLGTKAGAFLKRLHRISSSENQINWPERSEHNP